MYRCVCGSLPVFVISMAVAGCSGTGAAMTGGRAAMNLFKKDGLLKM